MVALHDLGSELTDLMDPTGLPAGMRVMSTRDREWSPVVPSGLKTFLESR